LCNQALGVLAATQFLGPKKGKMLLFPNTAAVGFHGDQANRPSPSSEIGVKHTSFKNAFT